MAQITPEGPVRKTLAEYRAEREEDFRGALGANLNVDPETPQGQIIGIEAESLSEADDAIIEASNQLSIYNAKGIQVDGLFSLLVVKRLPAVSTTVAVDLTGVPATFIPLGTKAKTITGDQFALNADVTLDGSGMGAGVMSALVTGPIDVPINTLTQIVDVVPGWETVDNAAAGVLGENQETDDEYVRRYLDSIFINARSPLFSVRANVLTVPGVTNVEVAENDTAIAEHRNGVLFDPKSLGVAVQGGDDTAIAEAIQFKKTTGCLTIGNITKTVPQKTGSGADSTSIDISFFRVIEIRTVIDVTITTNANFPADGISQIKNNIINYFAGTIPIQGSGLFELDGIEIGEDVGKSRLYTPVNAVPGHVVNSLGLKEFGGLDTEVLTVNFDQRAVIEVISDITVTIL